MKGYFSPLFFNSDWTISSSGQDATRCRLTLVSLVSELSLVLPRA